ncbi:MAG: class I SAM-dependent methyltransferase [Betaproteobacteria bacterium]
MRATQASSTARVIAASTLLLASDPRTAAQVAPDAAALCRRLLSANRADRWLAGSAVHPLTRMLWRWVEKLTLPGIISHYWHRKRWIETRCRAAIGEGFTRVIVLGAGFDTLGLRLAREQPHLEVIEIDHPATQYAKRRALEESDDLANPIPGNLRFVPCDLGAGELPAELFSDGKYTLFVVEGLLMYLPPAAIDRLFSALGVTVCRQPQGQGRRRVVFSFMSIWPDGRSGFRPHSRLVERWLAWRKEPFTWALEPEAMPYFLAIHRFRMLEMARAQELCAAGYAGSPLQGENMVVCEPA